MMMVRDLDTCIFYLAPMSQIATIFQNTHYVDPSLSKDGFMHFCRHEQVSDVVKVFFPETSDLKLLVVDISLLHSELRYESPLDRLSSGIFKDGMFPHLYGSLNVDAIIDVVDLARFNYKPIHPDTASMLRHYRFERLPVEGTLFKSTWRSSQQTSKHGPAGTAMIGLYANEPESISCFHKLDYEEVWHVYGGDPFTLYLLYPDGRTEDILMGTNPIVGELVQYVVPAGVWQAGCLNKGGRYALFGCTMAPGFTGTCFEAGLATDLVELYPSKIDIIKKLSVNEHQKKMPEGFAT